MSCPEHLNAFGIEIKQSEKGRGLYATRLIPAQTLLEISPVLLFEKDHGATLLDSYTFCWRDGRFALALGLGSLFNHHSIPNVSYILDSKTESIRYTTAKSIQPDEELCIFYGHNLWFDDTDTKGNITEEDDMEGKDDEFGGLSAIAVDGDEENEDLDALVAEHDLPFSRVRLTPDEDEEDEPERIRKAQAWVVDIHNPKIITTMLKWIKQQGLEDEALWHLKRIRKHPTADPPCSVLLLCLDAGTPPTLPSDLDLAPAYLAYVPLYVALTAESLKHKARLWPTVFAPRRKGEADPWSRGKVRWARDAMRHALKEAKRAKRGGEVPVVAYVPKPYEHAPYLPEPFIAHDTRNSAVHPLRHAILNVVRKIADHRATVSTTRKEDHDEGDAAKQNGNNYLLTDLALFITHEPCIMCSMALLHSRVKEVFYLLPMEKTGGCGGAACVPRLEGVNHRYAVARWNKSDEWGIEDVAVDSSLDA